MNTKKILLSIAAVLIIVGMCLIIFASSYHFKKNSKIQVVVSNFASYDFLRAIIGNNEDVELTFLMGPGKDAHSYDPTAKDLVAIQNADLFVYVGGEMEKWAPKVLDSLNTDKTKVICIADFVDTMEEKKVDGAEEHEHEEEHEDGHEDEHDGHEKRAFDEHIWSSPSNAIKMVNSLEKAMEEIDKDNSKKYQENAKNYVEKIKEVDSKIQNIVDNKVRNRLVFGDKMPMQYFIDYYNLEVSAAFDGCSTETEASASTIAYLKRIVQEENIPIVLYIELNNGKVAKLIAEEAGNGVQAMQIQAIHNVSLEDFRNGETWVSLMERNIDVLKKALQ